MEWGARASRLALPILIAIVAGTTAASASTFNYSSYSVVGQNISVKTPRSVTGVAGAVTLKGSSGNLLVFCLDVYDNLSNSGSYTISKLTTSSQLTTNASGSSLRLTSTQISEIGSLILNYENGKAAKAAPVGTSAASIAAAIQIAIWSVEYNNPYYSSSLHKSVNTTSTFTYMAPTSGSNNITSGTINLANTFVANIESGGSWDTLPANISVQLLTAAGNQTMVYVTPLPGALPLFATGLGVLGLLARHRKRKADVAGAQAARIT